MKKPAYLVVAVALACALCSCAQTGANASGSAASEGAFGFSPEALATSSEEGSTAADEEAGNAEPNMDMSLQEYVDEHGGALAEAEQGAADVPEATDGYMPDDLERMVIGEDDRVTVTNTFEYPYSAIALIKPRFKCGCTGDCTGFMVQPNVMLTAGHCVRCADHAQDLDHVTFYFGYQENGDYALRYDGPIKYDYGIAFYGGYSLGNMEWDYGIVRFDEPIGNTTGYFGMVVKSDEELEGAQEYTAGYRDGAMKFDSNLVEVRSDKTMWTSIDTVAGNSGGPIFDKDRACGIHIAEMPSEGKNVGYRISKEIIAEVLKMQDPRSDWRQAAESEEGTPGSEPSSGSSSAEEPAVVVVEPEQTGKDGYVLAESATRKYSKDDISGLSDWGLCIARNEIAARHGFIFDQAELQEYFEAKSWYKGTISGTDFNKNRDILNQVEWDNVLMIVQMERDRGSIYAV